MNETQTLEHGADRQGDRMAGPAALDGAPLLLPRFARAADRDNACEELAAIKFVVVEIEGVGPSAGGRLGEIIDEAIERELQTHGAAGPGMIELAVAKGANERDAVLSDQLYRARRAGAAGIAVVLGPLRAAARPSGALDPRDCAALRHLANASRERALVLILDARDALTGGYADPIALERLLLPPAGELEGSGAPLDVTRAVGPRERSRSEERAPASDEPWPSEALRVTRATARVEAERGAQGDPSDFTKAGELEGSGAPLDVTRLAGRASGAERAKRALAERGAQGDPSDSIEDNDSWRRWTLALEAARGPQALGALEKTFTESYTPLGAALASGLDDPRAKSVYEEFRNAFIRSYTDAFPTFAATTKRPRMALDVHDIAGKAARLHGARSTRLLLVDAMRWDLSRAVSGRLASKLGSRAALTDELVLWSALPTKTTRQLETIARGVEALRAPAELDVESEPPRGRTSEYVRRMRVGPRELCKLDLVEARIAAARGAVIPALPEIAESAADVIARHVDTLAPHTLLFIFGDHGFTVDRAGSARQGGASPEEVLVGAFALLVGDVH